MPYESISDLRKRAERAEAALARAREVLKGGCISANVERERPWVEITFPTEAAMRACFHTLRALARDTDTGGGDAE